ITITVPIAVIGAGCGVRIGVARVQRIGSRWEVRSVGEEGTGGGRVGRGKDEANIFVIGQAVVMLITRACVEIGHARIVVVGVFAGGHAIAVGVDNAVLIASTIPLAIAVTISSAVAISSTVVITITVPIAVGAGCGVGVGVARVQRIGS